MAQMIKTCIHVAQRRLPIEWIVALFHTCTYARLKLYNTTSFTVKVKHGEETTFLLLRGRTKLCWLINFYVCSHVTGSVYLFVIVFNLYLGLFCDPLYYIDIVYFIFFFTYK